MIEFEDTIDGCRVTVRVEVIGNGSDEDAERRYRDLFGAYRFEVPHKLGNVIFVKNYANGSQISSLLGILGVSPNRVAPRRLSERFSWKGSSHKRNESRFGAEDGHDYVVLFAPHQDGSGSSLER